jgi:predicted DNA repair protein MutK
MKLLSVVGTAAMFLVGGGILVHGWPQLHHLIQQLTQPLGGLLAPVAALLGDAVSGIIAGTLVLLLVMLGKKVFHRITA